MIDILIHHRIPLLAETDVLVIGAGSAGCLAALAAASQKKLSVMLVERYGFPGGTSTQMLDTFYGFFTPGTSPKKIVGGLPDRVVGELCETNDTFLRPNSYGAGTGVNYNPERLKLVWGQADNGSWDKLSVAYFFGRCCPGGKRTENLYFLE